MSNVLEIKDLSVSYGGIKAVKDRGLSIPEDVSIAGYDGLRIGQLLTPRFTTIWQDTETLKV